MSYIHAQGLRGMKHLYEYFVHIFTFHFLDMHAQIFVLLQKGAINVIFQTDLHIDTYIMGWTHRVTVMYQNGVWHVLYMQFPCLTIIKPLKIIIII